MMFARLIILGLILLMVVAKYNTGAGAALAKTLARDFAVPVGIFQDVRGMVASQPAAAVIVYSLLYLVLIAFSIPGCTMLTMVGAVLFGVGPAFPLVSLLLALGSGLAYGVSRCCGADILNTYLLDRLSVIRPLVRHAREHHGWRGVATELCFLRLSPFTQGWILNMAAPHTGCPVFSHMLAAFLGSLPRTLYTLVLGIDILAVVNHIASRARPMMGAQDNETAEIIAPLTYIRLLCGFGFTFSPLVLRFYNHMKSGSVAPYSDLYVHTTNKKVE